MEVEMKIRYITRGYEITLEKDKYTVSGYNIDDLKREFFRLLEDEIDAAINERLRQVDNEDFRIDFDDDLK